MSALTQVIWLIWKFEIMHLFLEKNIADRNLAFGTADLVYELQILNEYWSVAMRMHHYWMDDLMMYTYNTSINLGPFTSLTNYVGVARD